MRWSAGRQAAVQRGRRLWGRAALLLALVCAATQVPLVSAHADRQLAKRELLQARFYMQPTESRTTVCTGESALYRMAVYRAVAGGPVPGEVTTDVGGVKVEAFPDDAALGTFNKKLVRTLDFGLEAGVATADFIFTAGKKPGKTFLEFQGAIEGYNIHVGYVSSRIPIRVVDCKFKVSGVVFFPPDETYNPLPAPPFEGTIRSTQLTADDDGHLSAHAIIHWGNGKTIAKIPPDVVTVTSKFGPDQEVIVNGDVSDEGILTLTFEFPMANGTVTWTDLLGMTEPDQPVAFIVNKITVHIPTKGGTIKAPASYKTTGAGGTATIVVKKLKS